MDVKTPLLSVCMITFNHDNYVQQALKGILDQEINFDLELIISNDCSTDMTEQVILKMIQDHPKKSSIHYYNQPKNLGMMSNFIFALQKCKGKYVALCEGDDYWTDPLKLQKQVDLLESNEDVGICFHRAKVLKNTEFSLHPIPEPFDKKPFEYIELLKHYNFITTASVVFRKPDDLVFPKWFYQLPFGDMGLYKLVTKQRKIKCINEIMSVYRIHDEGLYSGLNNIAMKKNYLYFYKLIYAALTQEEKKIVKTKIIHTGYQISKLKYPQNPFLQYIYNRYLRLNL